MFHVKHCTTLSAPNLEEQLGRLGRAIEVEVEVSGADHPQIVWLEEGVR